jgi:hypothetical protein
MPPFFVKWLLRHFHFGTSMPIERMGASIPLLTDGGDLPADRMFRAALTSRSCVSPHALHTQVLTTSMSRPAGPVKALQLLHVRVVFLSLTMSTHLPACWPLYCNCVLSIPQPASNTDLAIRVFASFTLLTSPIFIF